MRNAVPPDDDAPEYSPRPFWSGTISFGLVSIPVDIYSAHRAARDALRMLAPDGTPLSRRYFCPKTNTELEWDDIVRGYEVEEAKFVVVTDEELEAIAPEKSRDIDLRLFVDAASIDPRWLVRSYYLTPAGDSTKAYRLLARVMEERNRAGIATFVMRGKEYLVAIRASGGILRAETLRFADELREAPDIGPAKKTTLDRKRVAAIRREIERRLTDDPGLDELPDTRTERLRALVERKLKRGEDIVGAPEEVEAAEGGPQVIDLMEVLKERLGREEAA